MNKRPRLEPADHVMNLTDLYNSAVSVSFNPMFSPVLYRIGYRRNGSAVWCFDTRVGKSSSYHSWAVERAKMAALKMGVPFIMGIYHGLLVSNTEARAEDKKWESAGGAKWYVLDELQKNPNDHYHTAKGLLECCTIHGTFDKEVFLAHVHTTCGYHPRWGGWRKLPPEIEAMRREKGFYTDEQIRQFEFHEQCRRDLTR